MSADVDILLEAPESVMLQAEGGSSEVSFECNSDALTIELAEGASWLRVDKRTAKTFTLVAEANADKHNRTLRSPSPQGRSSVSWRSPSWDSLPTSSPC